MNEHHGNEDGMINTILRSMIRMSQQIEQLLHRINNEDMNRDDRNFANYRLAQLKYSLQHAQQTLDEMERDVLDGRIQDLLMEMFGVNIDEDQAEGQQEGADDNNNNNN